MSPMNHPTNHRTVINDAEAYETNTVFFIEENQVEGRYSNGYG